jgi:hypothetical protein
MGPKPGKRSMPDSKALAWTDDDNRPRVGSREVKPSATCRPLPTVPLAERHSATPQSLTSKRPSLPLGHDCRTEQSLLAIDQGRPL